ncbi:DUF2272 domain-containing protein [Sediminicoccus sp. KRV36]|uniref:DUF2272 domain-containing protein n=1 Tax=Sediminicoccus sp. KRV36 TaxID=3133721 RepID=UPI00200F71FD|nr:DUF2272 domain-containing protein [Sediminicoccus rosea]UPY37532.1 DUF2272 domain-containing protein [Sediminicoccus rosea]
MLRFLPVLVLLIGCAGPPQVAQLPPPLSYPPAARERMLRLAAAEWQDWGCVSVGLPGPAHASCAPGAPASPESAPQNFPRVLAYWRAVPQSAEAIPSNRRRYEQALQGEGGANLWAEPFWSAAFISWVIGAAGVDAPEFAPDASHSRYLDHLDALAAAYPAQAPFLPRDPALYAPAPGDLVCRDRSSRPLRDWAERAAERGQFRPMHCDIVLTAGSGVVEAVGGNVSDTVALARWATDAEGRLLPDPRPFLVIMENRLGRTPPFGPHPPQDSRS